jgi:predicted GTPase
MRGRSECRKTNNRTQNHRDSGKGTSFTGGNMKTIEVIVRGETGTGKSCLAALLRDTMKFADLQVIEETPETCDRKFYKSNIDSDVRIVIKEEIVK